MTLQKVLSRVRQAVDDYHMIEEGDRIAVGISGGKDSLTLLSPGKKVTVRGFLSRNPDLITLSTALLSLTAHVSAAYSMPAERSRTRTMAENLKPFICTSFSLFMFCQWYQYRGRESIMQSGSMSLLVLFSSLSAYEGLRDV